MDEQSICWYYYERPVTWTHIHPMYNFIPWHPHWVDDPDKERPSSFHYFGSADKPWSVALTS